MAVQKDRRAAARKPSSQAVSAPADKPTPEDVRRRIEMAAYFRARDRGFAPGYELDDWLAAEREVMGRLQA